MFSARAGRVATAVLVVAVVMLNPPVVQWIDEPTVVVGFAPLYLWLVGWGGVIVATLIWTAANDAFGIPESEVPDAVGAPDRPGATATDGGADRAGDRE